MLAKAPDSKEQASYRRRIQDAADIGFGDVLVREMGPAFAVKRSPEAREELTRTQLRRAQRKALSI